MKAGFYFLTYKDGGDFRTIAEFDGKVWWEIDFEGSLTTDEVLQHHDIVCKVRIPLRVRFRKWFIQK